MVELIASWFGRPTGQETCQWPSQLKSIAMCVSYENSKATNGGVNVIR